MRDDTYTIKQIMKLYKLWNINCFFSQDFTTPYDDKERKTASSALGFVISFPSSGSILFILDT